MKLFCVVVDAAGGWEAECVYSVWDSESDATQEADRLNNSGLSLGCGGGRAYVVATNLNEPSDDWIA